MYHLFPFSVPAEDLEIIQNGQREVYETMKAQRQILMERLTSKMELLKKLCLEEAVSDKNGSDVGDKSGMVGVGVGEGLIIMD